MNVQTDCNQTAEDIRSVCAEVMTMLIKKNESYGDSALNPIRVFSKADAIQGILVRIDDKISRLQQGKGSAFQEDAELDLLGYLILLRIARMRKKRAEQIALGVPIPNDEPIGKTVVLQ